MARFNFRIQPTSDLEDLIRQLNHVLTQLTVELSRVQGSDGATFQNTSLKIGLYSAPPVVQASKISDPSGGATVDTEARAAITSIIDALEGVGISADS